MTLKFNNRRIVLYGNQLNNEGLNFIPFRSRDVFKAREHIL
jgi:hypothetical protein